MDILTSNRSNVQELQIWKSWVFDDPPKFHPMWFENIQEQYWSDLFRTYWKLPFYSGGIYLVLIFSLQVFMRNRKALQLKRTLLIWNVAIGLFSIMGFIRTFPELYGIVTSSPNGFYRSVCTR